MGIEYLNKLVEGMPKDDAEGIKLMLGFQLSIKSSDVIDGKLVIERETGRLNASTLLSKLDIFSKNKDSKGGKLADKMNYVVNELKAFYTNSYATNTDTTNQDNSVTDNFIGTLYSKNSVESTSVILQQKEFVKSQFDENVNEKSALESLLTD